MHNKILLHNSELLKGDSISEKQVWNLNGETGIVTPFSILYNCAPMMSEQINVKI